MTTTASRARWTRLVPLAWAVATLLALAPLSAGPGVSREEAAVLAAAGAAAATPGEARPPLPALLSRASHAVSARLGLPQLAGHRLASVVATALLAALVALLAGELAGPAAAALAPALLLASPRLLLPLLQAGPRATGALLVLAALLAYRRAALAVHRTVRLAAVVACGVLFGLALAVQLQSIQLLAVVAAHAALAPLLLRLRGAREPDAEPEPEPALGPGAIYGPVLYERRPSPPEAPPPPPARHPRSAALALGAMLVVGPAVALATWPWLWTDTLRRAGAALAGIAAGGPVVHMGRLLEAGRLPWGYPVLMAALAVPAALAATFLAGLLHGAWRLARSPRNGGLSDELLLVLAALVPPLAAQLGLAAHGQGVAPWLAAFPILAVLAARALLAAAATVWPARARVVAASLAAAVLAPAVTAAVHAYPALGSAWSELAGGAPGAASLGLQRHDGEGIVAVLPELSGRARPGAKIYWASIPPAAVALYAADGRLRQDVAAASTLDDADLAVIPVTGVDRRDEYAAWAALGTSTPVAGAFLDEVPLAWIYARPGAWR